MRIACPDCAAEYEVPDHLLVGAPRAMRCARCGRVWTPQAIAPPPPAPAPALAPELEPLAVTVLEAPPQTAAPARPPRRIGLLLAWIFTLAMLIGILAGTLTRRDQIVQAWPPAERAYRAVGL
ncbi:MAG TPA: zinc-ribbon domain-containing protein [Roseomonas sp.]|jgi:predicted Zn finger-like uncharacterized protein